MISDFHFIRPFWLLALIPSVVIPVMLVRKKDLRRAWQGVVAEHLLPFVVWNPSSTNGFRPHLLLGLVLILATFALAGPTWKREPAPFAEDQAALVIALKVTPTMLAQDIQPSRLERATQKIKDLLERRQGSPTALVAYAGSAHLVTPLTKDGDLVAAFATALKPEIMPIEGDAADQAIRLAQMQLTQAGQSGSVLLIADGVPAGIIKKQAAGLPRVHVYGVAAGPEAVVPPESPPAPPLNLDNLKKVATAGGGSLVLVTPDASDVERLTRIVENRVYRGGQSGERRTMDRLRLLASPPHRLGHALVVSTGMAGVL